MNRLLPGALIFTTPSTGWTFGARPGLRRRQVRAAGFGVAADVRAADYIDEARRGDGKRCRLAEETVAGRGVERVDEGARRGELLDSVLARVADVDARGRRRDPARTRELPVAGSLRSPRALERAVRVEMLDARVRRVDDVDAVRADRDTA